MEMPLVKPEELLAAFWEWNKTLDADFIPSQTERFIKVTEIQRDADLAILQDYKKRIVDLQDTCNQWERLCEDNLRAERLKEAEWLEKWVLGAEVWPEGDESFDVEKLEGWVERIKAHIASLKGDRCD